MRPIRRRTLVLLAAGVLCTALFSFAFIAAPHSCEWGATAYFLAGVATLAALVIAPMAIETDSPMLKRAALGLGLSLVTLIVWFAGLFAANVRILCRLF